MIFEKENQPFTPKDLINSNNMQTNEGNCHAIVVDGKINDSNLKLCQKNRLWLEKYLLKHNYKIKDIFLFTINDNNDINIIMKDLK